MPVAGRPRFFLANIFSCRAIEYLLAHKRAERKCHLPPGPNQQTLVEVSMADSPDTPSLPAFHLSQKPVGDLIVFPCAKAVATTEGKSEKPAKSPLDDITFILPFVEDIMKGRNRIRRSFSPVKPTGRYHLDCMIGRMLARKYLQYIQERAMLPLQWIVADMPRKLSGLEVGFLGGVTDVTYREAPVHGGMGA